MSIPYNFYNIFIDPMLKSVRTAMAEMIPPGMDIIDLACGTGDFILYLSGKCHHCTGIDLNETMIFQINRKLKKGVHDHLSFHTADGRNLGFIKDKQFDYASISMGLHEMAPSMRHPILKEMQRVAKNLVIADYAVPLPRNKEGMIIRIIEKLAGKDHYAGFCSFRTNQGLDALLKEEKLSVVKNTTVLNGTIRIVLCSCE